MKFPRTDFYERTLGRLLVCLLIAVMVLLLKEVRLFSEIENRIQDFEKSLAASQKEASKEIVIVAIDDESLQTLSEQINRYPWPRGIYECIVDYCGLAKVISFDLLLNEAENKNEFTIQDGAFIEAVEQSQNVVSAVHLLPSRINSDTVDLLKRFEYPNDFSQLQLPIYHSALAPYGRLLEATKGIGSVNVTYEAGGDSIERTYRLLSDVDGHVYPSLALATCVQYLGIEPKEVTLDEKRVLHIGDRKMKLKEDGSFHFRAHKPPASGYSYKHYSFIDIIRAWTFEGTDKDPGNINRETFRDKLVFLGSFATGLFHDEVSTPTNAKLPGVVLHAMVTDNLLNEHDFTATAPYWQILIIILACLIAPSINHPRPLYNFYQVAGVILVYLLIVIASIFLFAHLLPIGSPVMGLTLSSFFVGLVNWNKERQERAKLQAIELAKQQFTDMLVHDLRGRVATMTTSLEILPSMNTEEPLEQTPIYRTLKTSTQRLLGEVTSLLDIRRIEEGRMPIERQPLSINTTVETAVRDYEMAAELLHLKFQEEYKADRERFIHLDQDIIRRILGNLVWNAIQYGRKESALLIRTESDEQGVHVSVANRGRSIPADSQDTIFQPFVAENVEKNLVNVSTGLGLTFCKLGTEAHHGTIKLESPWLEHGDGVKITMFFPWKGNESVDAPPPVLT